MNPEEIQQAIKKWQSHVGRKGGQSTSEKKRAAARANALRAREVREEKRRKALGK